MLYPAILLFCSIGVYTINNTSFDVMQTAAFGFLGVRVREARMRAGAAAAGLRARPDDGGEPAPRAAALARRSDGVLHPPAVARDAADGGALLLLIIVAPNIRKKREEAFQEGE